MTTKKLRCRWCGLMSLLPLEAQSLSCPSCQTVTMVQGGYNSHRPSGGYVMPMNGYGPNPGYPPYGRPQRPVNAGNPYVAQPQHHGPMNTGNNYQVPPQLRPPAAHGRKRAVLCGINYKGHKQSLQGSINDVLLMKNLLVGKLGFPNASVLVLTEEEDYSRIPTKKNIRSALRWLVYGCQPGDSLVFHYSGHGSQVRDRNGDEIDGYDESLLPVDYEFEGRILDDEINATIVRPLTQGVTLHAIIDTCFSGTFLDLPNVCKLNRQGFFKWDDHRVPHAYKGTNGGYAISISACEDHQNSGDTTAFTGAPTGALTYSFIQTLEYEPRLSYGRLLEIMSKRINSARDQVGLNDNASNASQEPQLSSSHKFDIHVKPFIM